MLASVLVPRISKVLSPLMVFTDVAVVFFKLVRISAPVPLESMRRVPVVPVRSISRVVVSPVPTYIRLTVVLALGLPSSKMPPPTFVPKLEEVAPSAPMDVT